MILEFIAPADGGRAVYGVAGTEDFLSSIEDPDVQASWTDLLLRLTTKSELLNRALSKPMGDGLFEFRADRIRLLYYHDPERRLVVIIVNHFYKKSQQTQKQYLKLAHKRLKQIELARKLGDLYYEGDEER